MPTVDLSHLVPALAAELRVAAEEAHRQLLDSVHEAAMMGLAFAVQETDRKKAVDAGQYKRSWQARRMVGGAELYNDAPYAGVIEYGRRPNSTPPPYAVILKWVRRKNLTPTPKPGRGRRRAATRRSKAELQASLAWAIRASIAKRGIKGRFLLRATERRLPGYVAVALRRRGFR